MGPLGSLLNTDMTCWKLILTRECPQDPPLCKYEYKCRAELPDNMQKTVVRTTGPLVTDMAAPTCLYKNKLCHFGNSDECKYDFMITRTGTAH